MTDKARLAAARAWALEFGIAQHFDADDAAQMLVAFEAEAPRSALCAYTQGRKDEYEHTVAWAEQLAARWDQEAQGQPTREAIILRTCANDLRAAARRSP
jgi:hypothetical protein